MIDGKDTVLYGNAGTAEGDLMAGSATTSEKIGMYCMDTARQKRHHKESYEYVLLFALPR